MFNKAGITGDPRRPSDVRRYTRKKAVEGEQPPDILLMVAMMLGLGGLMLKAKMLAWLGVFCCLPAVSNISSEAVDSKQLVSSVTCCVLGLIASYVAPNLAAAAVARRDAAIASTGAAGAETAAAS